jgi:hypothetical protein
MYEVYFANLNALIFYTRMQWCQSILKYQRFRAEEQGRIVI